MVSNHPFVKEIEAHKMMGRAEAEQHVRGLAAGYIPTDRPEVRERAARAVREIDQEYADAKAKALAANTAAAAALGLDLGQARKLVDALAADRNLYSWLCARVHLTIAHDNREIADDE